MLVLGGQAAPQADQFVAGLIGNHRAVALNAPDRAMLDYAVLLTRTPNAVTAANVDGLRSAGFDDRAIHDIATITAYYAFVNRVADGLGVELESTFGTP